MPVAVSYPGVYIQEVPSGVRTIAGVATSITAFVGRAAAGPTDDPQLLTGFADYERRFGGLDAGCPMSYAVRDFYLNGVQDLQINLNDLENGQLNPLGINCLRSFGVSGRIVWGARTLRGADANADEYKYLPVRRLALYLEESLYRGTQWVVFEPNDEPLWAQIRLNVGAFMQGLFRQGAFQGATPRDAYFVRCDSQTTTQNDINLGVVNVVVGFAPLKPAEFVVIQIQQMAGQIAV